MTLTELYDAKRQKYVDTGKKEEPSKLLALLLLEKKEEFLPLEVEEGKFYHYYQEIIDKNIAKVNADFQFSDDDYKKLITEKLGYFEENSFEEDKLWQVFGEGIGALHWGLMYMTDKTGIDIYSYYFDENILLNKVKKIGGIK